MPSSSAADESSGFIVSAVSVDSPIVFAGTKLPSRSCTAAPPENQYCGLDSAMTLCRMDSVISIVIVALSPEDVTVEPVSA